MNGRELSEAALSQLALLVCRRSVRQRAGRNTVRTVRVAVAEQVAATDDNGCNATDQLMGLNVSVNRQDVWLQ